MATEVMEEMVRLCIEKVGAVVRETGTPQKAKTAGR